MITIPSDFPIKSKVLAHGEVDGIPWVAARAPIYDAVNGYCRLPDGHPWLDLDTEKIETTVPWGEITYSQGNWVGFDTLHGGQYWPAMDEWRQRPLEGDTFMTDDMVIGWAERLAAAAAAALAEGGEES